MKRRGRRPFALPVTTLTVLVVAFSESSQAAPLKSHKAPAPARASGDQPLQQVGRELSKLTGISSPGNSGSLSLSNPLGSLSSGADSTLRSWRKDMLHLLHGHSRSARVTPLHHASASHAAHVASHIASSTVTRTPRAGAIEAASTGSSSVPSAAGANRASSPSVSAEVLAVPEPSGWLSALALAGLAGGWWRIGRLNARSVSV
jgi:hypothetical protein